MNEPTDWVDILIFAGQGLAFLIFAACVIVIKRQRIKKGRDETQ